MYSVIEKRNERETLRVPEYTFGGKSCQWGRVDESVNYGPGIQGKPTTFIVYRHVGDWVKLTTELSNEFPTGHVVQITTVKPINSLAGGLGWQETNSDSEYMVARAMWQPVPVYQETPFGNKSHWVKLTILTESKGGKRPNMTKGYKPGDIVGIPIISIDCF
ncbi:hypothetical protein BD410DRAFT_807584 [Rickenella mellea]|uniref:Uncharacterized protein n=1 Tax=Rickenella mellea TaxID=50990 RepID=A0A4Y7PNR5_9AGAM|nr:hypothetical protein BD410DRAFT_807584 [Rickenella mellea]